MGHLQILKYNALYAVFISNANGLKKEKKNNYELGRSKGQCSNSCDASESV